MAALGTCTAAALLLAAAFVLGLLPSRPRALPLPHPVPEHVHRMENKLDMRHWMERTRRAYEADGVAVPGECENDFGLPYIDAWLRAEAKVCTGNGSSSVTCHKHPPKHDGEERGSVFCYADNLVLDSAEFLGRVAMRAPKQLVDDARQVSNKFPEPKKGARGWTRGWRGAGRTQAGCRG